MNDFTTLLFPDRRVDGAFPVLDATGARVAKVTAAWSGGRFTATALDGTPLCTGTTSRWLPTGKWQVSDGTGGPLLTVAAKVLRSVAAVTLADGRELVVRGSAWRRDFVVTDRAGSTVLSATPRTSALSLRQHDYAVTQPTPGLLSLAEVIAVVQVWRMVKQSDVAVLAATTSATVAASGA